LFVLKTERDEAQGPQGEENGKSYARGNEDTELCEAGTDRPPRLREQSRERKYEGNLREKSRITCVSYSDKH